MKSNKLQSVLRAQKYVTTFVSVQAEHHQLSSEQTQVLAVDGPPHPTLTVKRAKRFNRTPNQQPREISLMRIKNSAVRHPLEPIP